MLVDIGCFVRFRRIGIRVILHRSQISATHWGIEQNADAVFLLSGLSCHPSGCATRQNEGNPASKKFGHRCQLPRRPVVALPLVAKAPLAVHANAMLMLD